MKRALLQEQIAGRSGKATRSLETEARVDEIGSATSVAYIPYGQLVSCFTNLSGAGKLLP